MGHVSADSVVSYESFDAFVWYVYYGWRGIFDVSYVCVCDVLFKVFREAKEIGVYGTNAFSSKP